MSVKLPPPLKVETMLGAVDLSARRTAGRARTHTVAAVKRLMPARSGRARSAAAGSVKRTALGYVITVAPRARVRYPSGITAVEVTRFVEKGTMLQGPRKRVPRRLGRLPSGAVPTGRGQRAQHVYARAESTQEATVTRMLQAGADDAAREAERVLGA